MRTYVYLTTPSSSGPTTATRNTTYVGKETGLPRRTITAKVTVDYYDYGAKFEITPSPCG